MSDIEYELQVLIEEWKKCARQSNAYQNDTFNARCETYARCAEELAEVVNDVE